MAKRIFELARELGVTSKLVLGKCRAEGLDIKNHMSTVSAGLAETIREWFSEEEAKGSAVETTEHVDLKKAHAEARKLRRRRPKKAEPPAEEPTPAETPGTPVAEAPSAAPDTAAEVPAAVAEPVAEAPAEPADEAPAAEAPTEPSEAKKPADKPKKQAKKPKKPPGPVKPAGPQVVPQPAVMKGPRVVRVEKPDIIDRPRRRTPSAGPQPLLMPVPGMKRIGFGAEEYDARKGKSPGLRSPRRRGGTTGRRGSGAGQEVGGGRKREIHDQDMQERTARLAAAVGGGMRRHRASVGKKALRGPVEAKTGTIEVQEPLTIKNISAATAIKSPQIIRKLMEMGVLATVNRIIDREVAETVLLDFGIELVVRRAKSAEEEFVEALDARAKGETVSRAPVVTFLGHVDHGKTSLLDYIRKTAVAGGEAGGITQHIGAYRYDTDDKHVVFLDTPGHEAFTAMRARGANITDVVVLVVAADDGVMPQTIEAINHAKVANVPIVVALNKIDVPNANPTRALSQLAEHGLNPQEWGGETEVIQTDAITGTGIDSLVETLSLEAELLELRAEVDAPASGYVVEAKMDRGLGALARLLVLNGTLRIGDVLLAGSGHGRVRQMKDCNGKVVAEAGPATPVEVSGLVEVPQAGDRFFVIDDIEQARSVAQDRRQRTRTESLATGQQITLEDLFSKIEADQVEEVRLIVKADVAGSIEALLDTLNNLSTDEVRVNILHSAVGGISTGDVALAEASDAIIIGFNVVPDPVARQEAEAKGVDIRLYRVIYDVVNDIRGALEAGLAPEIKTETLGHAEVRQTFKVSRVGTIAGCYVTDGVVQRNAKIRITRDNVVIEDDRELESLKRFKDDAREVRSGMECGIKIAGYDDIKEGDVFEVYREVEVARRL